MQLERNIPVGQLGDVIRKLARWVPEVGVEMHRVVHSEIFLDLPRRSPVGKWGQDPHPGKYRASHRSSVGERIFADLPDQSGGYAIPGAAELEATLQAITPATKRSFITNDAATKGSASRGRRRRRGSARRRRSPRSYASVLEGGWSPQASEGIYGPSVAAATRKADVLVARAIERAMRRYPR